jgi:plasmid stabilization system protein ParE
MERRLKIVWFPAAKQKQKEIAAYYTRRNGNSKYSRYIENQIKERLLLATHYPYMYPAATSEEIRYFTCEYFKVYYRIYPTYILVEAIFDTRQHPDKAPFTDNEE